MQIDFCPLETKDLGTLFQWFHQPHVKKFYSIPQSDDEQEFRQIYTQYSKGSKLEDGISKPISPWIISLESKPIGYIQAYNAYDFYSE